MEELGKEKEDCSLYNDIQNMIHLAKKSAFHSRTKCIQLRYHFIRKVLEDGQLKFEKIHIDEKFVDMLMNPFEKEKLELQSSSISIIV